MALPRISLSPLFSSPSKCGKMDGLLNAGAAGERSGVETTMSTAFDS